MSDVATIAALTAGGAICLVNFYLSFLRRPLFVLRGGKKEDFRWSSGIPLIGSLIVVLTLVFARPDVWLMIPGAFLAAIDTGGIHWFLGTMLWHAQKKQ
jgi:hypothetical protein